MTNSPKDEDKANLQISMSKVIILLAFIVILDLTTTESNGTIEFVTTSLYPCREA